MRTLGILELYSSCLLVCVGALEYWREAVAHSPLFFLAYSFEFCLSFDFDFPQFLSSSADTSQTKNRPVSACPSLASLGKGKRKRSQKKRVEMMGKTGERGEGADARLVQDSDDISDRGWAND
jgi:hypothetical protein